MRNRALAHLTSTSSALQWVTINSVLEAYCSVGQFAGACSIERILEGVCMGGDDGLCQGARNKDAQADKHDNFLEFDKQTVQNKQLY